MSMGNMSDIYEIRYGRTGGALACLTSIARANDEAAVRFAHALHRASFEQVEVWNGDRFVHRARLAPARQHEVA